jgi:FkbM family methyltransferase
MLEAPTSSPPTGGVLASPAFTLYTESSCALGTTETTPPPNDPSQDSALVPAVSSVANQQHIDYPHAAASPGFTSSAFVPVERGLRTSCCISPLLFRAPLPALNYRPPINPSPLISADGSTCFLARMFRNQVLKAVALLRNSIRHFQLRIINPTTAQKALAATACMPLYAAVLFLSSIYVRAFGSLTPPCVRISGVRFLCVMPDLIQRYIYLFHVWEPGITALIKRRVRTGDTFVDVGAHIGYYTLLAAQLVGTAGRVIAIEASPRNFALLSNNLALNQWPNQVRALNIAATYGCETLDVYAGPDQNLGMTCTSPRVRYPRQATIAAADLATILEREGILDARMIKIDVEGHEEIILRDINSLLRVCRKDAEFIIELSPRWWADPDQSLNRILQAFRHADYHPYVVRNDYKPWHYLWSSATQNAIRLSYDNLRQCLAASQLDVLFSRQDSIEI